MLPYSLVRFAACSAHVLNHGPQILRSRAAGPIDRRS